MTASILDTAVVVPGEVAGFLAHLAVAIHKQRAYPSGHPMRTAARDTALRSLGAVLATHPTLRIAVARHRLLIGGAATDPDHFVLRDLADRLHRRQIGSITFRAGLTVEDFTGFLDHLRVDPATAGEPADPTFTTPGVEVAPIAYDALRMGEQPAAAADEEADRLWRALANAVGDGVDTGGPEDAVPLAQLLLARLDVPEVRAAAAASLEGLGRLALTLDGDARAAAEARLRDLVATIPPAALGTLLGLDLSRPERLAELQPAVEWLPAMALVEMVEAAARSERQQLSHALLRLLRKLARQPAEGGPGAAGDRDLRRLIHGLIEDWSLEDPNSRSHAGILTALGAHDFGEGGSAVVADDQALRILQTALEAETGGDHVVEAVEAAIERKELATVIGWAAGAGSNPAATTVWTTLTAPGHLARILREDLPAESLAQVIERVGPAATAILIDDLLAGATANRRLLVDRLLRLGESVTRELSRRLEAAQPADRRRILSLLAEFPDLPEGLSLESCLQTPDVGVRREAYLLALRSPSRREQAVLNALTDDDEGIVGAAIEAGLDHLPRQALGRLMVLLNSPKRSLRLRAAATELLAQFDGPSVREWLLNGLVVRTGWLRRRRLAPKTPLVLARLRVLASRWTGSAAVDRALALAARSGDPEVIAAAKGRAS